MQLACHNKHSACLACQKVESWSLLLLLQLCTERVQLATDPCRRAMFHLFRCILYRVMMKMMLMMLLLLLLPLPCLLSNCNFWETTSIGLPHRLGCSKPATI